MFGPSLRHLDRRALVALTAAFVILFGGTNPLGASRYAKVDGEAGVALLPTYVAEAWEQVR